MSESTYQQLKNEWIKASSCLVLKFMQVHVLFFDSKAVTSYSGSSNYV